MELCVARTADIHMLEIITMSCSYKVVLIKDPAVQDVLDHIFFGEDGESRDNKTK